MPEPQTTRGERTGVARAARRGAVSAAAVGALALLTAQESPAPPARAAPAAPAPPAVAPAPSPGQTRVSMRNVAFHVAEGVVLHVRRLEGTMHGVRDDVVDLDDKTSYVTD